MLNGIEVETGVDFFNIRDSAKNIAEQIIYTGEIDRYFEYIYGPLTYRSLRFEHQLIETDNFQGNAVINYTEPQIPYTRIIEHKHFENSSSSVTVVTKEYPCDWGAGKEAYYPINNDLNDSLYKKYRLLAKNEKNVIFGGRLAEYKYYDMHNVISSALYTVKKILKNVLFFILCWHVTYMRNGFNNNYYFYAL